MKIIEASWLTGGHRSGQVETENVETNDRPNFNLTKNQEIVSFSAGDFLGNNFMVATI